MAKNGRQSGMEHLQGKDLNDQPFLPLDIIFHILILLPADFLYYSARYVCKAWANMLRDPSFIKQHLLKSKNGLLIQDYTFPSHGLFLDMEDGNLTETHLRRAFPGKPIDSCRSLCLFHMPYGRYFLVGQKGKRTDGSRALYVGNPVTMQIEVLPALSGWVECCHLAYILQTGRHMVVCLFKNYGIINGVVLTLGVDFSWRKLNLPLAGRIFDGVVRVTSAVVGEVAYISQSATDILAINLYHETSCFIQLPHRTGYTPYWLLKMGENLSCLVPEETGMNIYVLENSKKSEWAKVCQIADVITRNIPLFCLEPLGRLDNGHNIVLQNKFWSSRRSDVIIALNVETEETTRFSFLRDGVFRHILIHANSLIKW